MWAWAYWGNLPQESGISGVHSLLCVWKAHKASTRVRSVHHGATAVQFVNLNVNGLDRSTYAGFSINQKVPVYFEPLFCSSLLSLPCFASLLLLSRWDPRNPRLPLTSLKKKRAEMMRRAGRRLSSLAWRPNPASSSCFASRNPVHGAGCSSDDESRSPVDSPMRRLIEAWLIGRPRG